MFVIIAYDISNDRRRTRIHKTLKSYGTWTQFSLFECRLTEQDYIRLRQRLAKLLDPETDAVRFYFVCASCEKKVELLGKPLPPALDEPMFGE
ncbi:CRISPR-associated endonuclease Cas2 [Candidatus Cyanaurora vandensis]|uniref:CRISPR-associated endonuclease Cas2 n=1 Tax=Candidatus Cyanaurora vandensis TaxID=2714958 RepID=UPI00257DCFB6|nr:CRISPR-associated endonuclease Cas2 [Candidatus Cyanaurora vandensis]